MTTMLVWLALASLLWGGVLVAAGVALQSSVRASGAFRQMLWRGIAGLMILPWLAAPFAPLFPRPQIALPQMLPEAALASVSIDVAAPLMGEATVSVAPQVIPWSVILLSVLVAGWLARLVSARLGRRALKEIVASSRPALSGPALAALRGWTQKLGLRRPPELRLAHIDVSPFSYGVLRSVICLPADLERMIDPAALGLVVGHECLHVTRGDGLLRPIERCLADILWFNPFAWRIRRELDLARELACDEAVLDHIAAPASYARVLRDVAGLSLAPRLPATAMSLSGGGRVLVMRMKRVMRHAQTRPGRAAIAGAAILMLVGAPVAIAQAVLAAPPQPPSPRAPRAPDAPPPPLAPPNIYVSPDGVVRAIFASTVQATSGDAKAGFNVDLLQVAEKGAPRSCHAHLEGLDTLAVVAGQALAERQAIGTGNGPRLSLASKCSDQVDIKGEPMQEKVPVGSPFDARVTNVDRSQPLAAVEIEASAPIVLLSDGAVGHGCKVRIAGLSGVKVKPGDAVRAGAELGSEKAPAGFELRCRSIDTHIRLAAPAPPAPGEALQPPGPIYAPRAPAAPASHSTDLIAPAAPASPRAPAASASLPADLAAPAASKAPLAPAAPSQIARPAPLAPVAPLAAPVRYIPAPQTPPAPSSPPSSVKFGPPDFLLIGSGGPVLNPPARVTSGFGFRVDPFSHETAMHQGVDLAAQLGAQVHAPRAGSVAFAGPKPDLGNVVDLVMDGDVTARFAHLGQLSVKVGDHVNAGAVVGVVGTDSKVTGPHVHIEILNRHGNAVDPQQLEGLSLIGPG